jgi:hypothetical protein
MNRSLMTTVAALGLTMFAAAQTQAAGSPGKGSGHPSGSSSQHGTMSNRHGEFNHSFKANGRFDYGRHGFKSLSWTRSGWSDRYHSYCYWAPRYGWCFYEPTYSCYLPVSCYSEVYPQASLSVAPEVRSTPLVSTVPSVVQQTSVVLAAPAAPAVDLPGPLAAPPVGPGPGVVQQTKVGPGVP